MPLRWSGGEGLSSTQPPALVRATSRVVGALTRPWDPSSLLRTLSVEAAALLDADSACTCLLEPDGRSLRVRMGIGSLAPLEGDLLPIEGSLAGAAVLARSPRLSADVSSDSRAYRPRERGVRIGPALALPLFLEDRAVGALLVGRAIGDPPFAAGSGDFAQPFADVAAAALETARVYGEARRSEAELEQWRRERKLRVWLARHEAVARARGQVVFEWNSATGEMVWSASARPVLGCTAGEVGATARDWTEHLHPDDRKRVLAGLERVDRERTELYLDLRVRQADGSFARMAACIGCPADGPPAPRVLGFLVPVGVGGGASDEERDRRARAEAAREIVFGLRHEINNPLAVVMGQAQILKTESTILNDPVVQQSIDAIYDESARISELVRRLERLEPTSGRSYLNENGGLNIPPV